jgi:hypothetical protein
VAIERCCGRVASRRSFLGRQTRRGTARRRGSRGGRPVSHDSEDYKNRNVVERFFNRMKNWRGLATRYDKHAVVYRAALSSPPSWIGSSGHEARLPAVVSVIQRTRRSFGC